MLLGRLGSAWGWWNAEGAVFDVLGLVAAVWAAAYSASARALRGVTDDIAKIDDRLRTVGDQGERTVEILERIERPLTERLPLQSASPLPAADQGSEARSTLSRWLPWSRQRRTPVSPTPPSPPTSASGSPDLALALVVAGANRGRTAIRPSGYRRGHDRRCAVGRRRFWWGGSRGVVGVERKRLGVGRLWRRGRRLSVLPFGVTVAIVLSIAFPWVDAR
jgi:hypothetical protein